GRELGERVLNHVERGVALERATQLGQLGHRQPAVLGEHRAARGAELAGELLDHRRLLGVCHEPPSQCVVPAIPVPQTPNAPAPGARGGSQTWWLRLTVTCAGCPYGTFGAAPRLRIQRSSALSNVP